MRRALATMTLIAALAACGSPPTEQEQNLEERATGSGTLPVDNMGNAATNGLTANGAVDDAGARDGISGTTQGPTAADSDAPYAGEGSNSGN